AAELLDVARWLFRDRTGRARKHPANRAGSEDRPQLQDRRRSVGAVWRGNAFDAREGAAANCLGVAGRDRRALLVLIRPLPERFAEHARAGDDAGLAADL